MADIQALKILDGQIALIKKLPPPPTTDEAFEAFKLKTEECMETAAKRVEDVNKYAENVLSKLKDVKGAVQFAIQRIQEVMEQQLSKVVVTHKNGTLPNDNLKILERVQKLENLSKQIMLSRLNDLVMETERAYAKVMDESQLTSGDLAALKGCLDSWQKAKKESYEEEKRRIEEEKKRKEEADRKRKQEEEERKKKEEEERKLREEEERRRKEEEERKRKEEEERKLREEEERKEREEKERKENEAKEKREREDAERRRKEEKAALAKEVERQKREAERRRKEAEDAERERKRKEEEERTRRRNPDNWQPIVYNRPQADEVPGRKPFHNGVCCMVTAPPGGLVKDDIECNASDELDDVIEVLDDGEKPASSVVSVESKKGELNSDVAPRVFIPHCPIPSASEELVIKASVNGSDWLTSDAIAPGAAIANKVDMVSSNLVGVEINGFKSVKLMVVARPKGQTVVVDKSGLNVNSITDKNVKVFIPRDAFNERTAFRLVAQPISKETIRANAKEDRIWESVISTSSMITISSDKAPMKDIEVDIARGSDGKSKGSQGKLYHLYKAKDNVWKFGEFEYKGQNNVVSVTLPAHKDKCNFFELEMPANIPKEKVLKVAESVHAKMFKTPVRIIMKQLDDKPLEAVMMVVRSDLTTKCLEQLRADGYTRGPDVSNEFGLRDGQKLILTCAGNIGTSTGSSGKLKFTYFTYMNMVKQDLILHVNDIYKQKDLAEYMGMVKITVDDGTEFPSEAYDLMVTLPKIGKEKNSYATHTRVRFPYFLTSFARFVSTLLCEDGDVDWERVLAGIMGQKEFGACKRQAKRKVDERKQVDLCKTILYDWMKAKPRQDDKIKPIVDVLLQLKEKRLADKCEQFVQYQKDMLDDKQLEDIADRTPRTFDELKVGLKIASTTEGAELPTTKLDLLMEWRESDEVVKHGDKALAILKKICRV